MLAGSPFWRGFVLSLKKTSTVDLVGTRVSAVADRYKVTGPRVGERQLRDRRTESGEGAPGREL